MPTESTAIVRFISEAQQQAGQSSAMAEPLPPALTEDLRPARRSLRGPLLVAGAVGVIAAATVAGIFIGKHSATQDEETAPAAAPAPAAVIPPPSITPGDPADPAPGAAAVAAPAAIAPEVLAETGFDIRVKPPATISLDGRVLGTAPLRIRNLSPGAHVVDIDAPPGYFSRRVEIELDPGEPLNVNLALDPIEPAPEASQPADDDRPRRAVKDRRPARRAAAPAPARAADRKGTLMIGSKPPCDIYIDGAPTGLKTPQRAIELTAGTHRVTLVNGDLAIKQSFTVEIEAGKTVREVKDLTGKL